MNYKSFNLGDWIGHISGVIEDESELDGNEMRDLVEFLSVLSKTGGTPMWTPIISEGLPKKDGKYLCTTKDGETELYYFTADLGSKGVYQPVNGDFRNIWENGTELCESGKAGFYRYNFGDGSYMLTDDVVAYMPTEPYKEHEKDQIQSDREEGLYERE